MIVKKSERLINLRQALESALLKHVDEDMSDDDVVVEFRVALRLALESKAKWKRESGVAIFEKRCSICGKGVLDCEYARL